MTSETNSATSISPGRAARSNGTGRAGTGQPHGQVGIDGVRLPGDVLQQLLTGPDGDLLDSERARQLATHLVGLQQRFETLPVIEQAKGILMGRYAIDADRAFQLLCEWSSYHNLKVRTIARQLTAAVSHHKPADHPRQSSRSTLDQVIAIFERKPGSDSAR